MQLNAPPTFQSKHGGLLGTDRAITTFRLPLQTVGKIDIQQHLANPDTTSTLVGDTRISCADPPPSRWIDITLEQT